MRNTLLTLSLLLVLSGAPAFVAADDAKAPRESVLTLGAIQLAMKSGMSATEVIEAAGSPNLVTRGRNGREFWVYDRFSSETTEQGIQAGGGVMGAGSSLLGVIGVNGGKKKSTKSQTTLMLLVTFGQDGTVESFSYRLSRF